jgi:hypothetical protein
MTRTLLAAIAAAAVFTVPPTALADPGKGQPQKPANVPTPAELFANPQIGGQAVPTPADELAAAERATRSQPATASFAVCWTVQYTMRKDGWWGHWELWQQTTWCGRDGAITYRSTIDGQSASGACSPSAEADSWRTAGGYGYTWVTVKTQASFSCFVGWLNGSPWMEIAYTWGGAHWVVAWGENG